MYRTNKSSFVSFLALGLSIACVGISSVASAVTTLSTSPGNWSTIGDWNNGLPDGQDFVYIGGNGGVSPGIANMDDGLNTHTAGELWIGQGGQIGTLNISNGSQGTFDYLRIGPYNFSNGSTGTLNVDGAGSMATFTQEGNVGGEGSGSVNAINGGIVNFGSHLYLGQNTGETAALGVDASSQINMTGANPQLRIRDDSTHNNLDFTNTATNGKISVPTSTTLWVGQGGGHTTAVNLDAGSSGVTFDSLYMTAFDFSNSSTGVLNIAAATVTFSNNSELGGEGNATLGLTAGAIANFGSNLYLGSQTGRTSILSIDAASQVNLTGANPELRFRDDNTHNLNFANAPTNGKISMPNNSTLWVGQGGNHTTTLNMGAGSDGMQFGTLRMASFDFSGGTTGILSMTGAAVTFNDASLGGEGIGQANVVQMTGQIEGMTINNSLFVQSGNGSVLNLVFDNATGSGPLSGDPSTFDWALRWFGNHLSDLQTFYTGGELTVSSPNPFVPADHIFYSDPNDNGDGYTYVGFLQAENVVPEPSTLVLAALGMLGLGGLAWRRKHASHC